ncbi:hypothetical protein BDN72DRAFT_906190 [Pluteus cervinus]|uniref:Uncharacterized protein n=1 Tax=Pluteus cervinus TaxID=181527 RepID=A0ACD3A0G7_9AGAR|nr:hypothetical protein BDN72DRAFT_906190 [Pluteus cervinus]
MSQTASRKPAAPSKPSKIKASWNTDCDTILVNCLLDQRTDGFQTSNGNFQKDAFTASAAKLAGTEKVSGGGCKDAECCQNRYAALKKEFTEVEYLRNSSGFGWDETTSLVQAEASIWEKIVKLKASYNRWKKKAFPLYNDMHSLINGTYATGQNVFQPGAPASPVTPVQPSGGESPPWADFRDEEDDDHEPALPPSQEASQSSASGSSLKRKSEAVKEEDSTPSKRAKNHGRPVSAAQGIDKMANSLMALAKVLVEPERAPVAPIPPVALSSPERKTAAVTAISDIDGISLSSTNKIQAYCAISQSTAIADVFLAIPKEDERISFILALQK